MSRAKLNASTAIMLDPVPSGLLDASGASIPSTRSVVDVRTLPLIEADALPPLPRGIEARFYQDPAGDNHIIVLWSPVHEVSVEVPLADKDHLQGAAAKLSQAIGHATMRVN